MCLSICCVVVVTVLKKITATVSLVSYFSELSL